MVEQAYDGAESMGGKHKEAASSISEQNTLTVLLIYLICVW